MHYVLLCNNVSLTHCIDMKNRKNVNLVCRYTEYWGETLLLSSGFLGSTLLSFYFRHVIYEFHTFGLTESFQNIICYLFKQSYSRQSIWKLIDSRTMVCTKYHILVHDIWYLFRKNFIPKSVYISYILNVKGCLKQVW